MRFHIETYGCQMNVADSELITTILLRAGFEPAKSLDEADVIMFNTCSVRAHAEERVLGRVSNELSRKRNKPELKVGLVGCMAQRMGKSLLDRGIDFVVGVDQYQILPDIIMGRDQIHTEFDQTQLYPGLIPTHHSKTCAYITIMRGCNNFCSYCIVPFVRGRERSRPWQEIFNETREAGSTGLKEITLLGQNVNSYHDGIIDFAGLLRKLNSIESIERIRFVTSHPKDLSDDLIESMSGCEKVCEHIHLPMQSGSSRILQVMNRGYSSEHYYSLITKLRKSIPNIAITTDIIAGFPSETEAEFNDTLAVMRDMEFDYAFCFKFSPREGTAAAGFDNQIQEEVRLERLQKMIELQRQITLSRFQAKIGKNVEVYIEDVSRKNRSQVSGKTRDFKIAVLSGTESEIGTLKQAKVKDATAGTLICE